MQQSLAAYQSLYRAIPDFESTGVEGISAGNRIETSKGFVSIQALQVGDLIRTADKGFLPLLWKGATRKSGRGRDAPVLIPARCLGNLREVIVAPRQRIALSGPNVSLLFSKDQVLVAARNLVNDHSIWRLEMEEVVYYHLLLKEHSVIFADGCQTESLHLTTLDWHALALVVRQELISNVSRSSNVDEAPFFPAARSILNAYEACQIRLLM